jgi:polyisoprenoid-binding protein YceI
MRSNARLAALSLLAALPAAIAWRSAGDPLALAPQSKLWIDGKSTVRKFTCKAGAFTVDVDAAPGAIGAVLAGEKAVRTVVVKVPAEKMDCGNGTMNEHMLKALKAKDAPMIEFTLASYDVAKGAAGVQGTLRGSLSLGGTTQPVAIAAQAAEAGSGLLRVTGAYELHMTTFGLKPPSLMMGTMKVDEAVTVNFDLLLKSTAVAALEH